MYTLNLTTSYAESWRYNIMVTLAMLDSNGEQVGYHSTEDSPLPVGTNKKDADFNICLSSSIIVNFNVFVESVN